MGIKSLNLSIGNYYLVILLCVSVSLWLISVVPAIGQVRPVYDQGALGLGQLLKRLNTTASVMMIGAHPDDEDTALLAYLARGENARTAYLSLTRGDGGQNIIGNELGESLGVIRTEELLQARRLDGAEQYFTRAYDYGFSKTLAEAKLKWDEKIILCDAVRVIRNFRPLVVVSQFSGTPADGHGQHQYSGYIAPLAVKASADAAQCASSGPPWNVSKFYVRHRGSGEPGLRINTGKYDFLLGRSYFEIAMEARSQHKSQEQGVLELKGEQFSALNRADGGKVEAEKESGIFDGTSTSIADAGGSAANSSGFLPSERQPLEKLSESVSDIFQKHLLVGIGPLLQAYAQARQIEGSNGNSGTKAIMRQKQKELLAAVRMHAGVQIDALIDKETIVPGEEAVATVKLFYPETENVKLREIRIQSPENWKVEKIAAPAESTQGFFRRETARASENFKITIPGDAQLTRPYWLGTSRRGDLFQWENNDNQTLPFGPPPVFAEIKIDIQGTEIVFEQPLQFRYADDVRGEVRRDLNIVPRVSIEFDQELLIVRSGAKADTKKIVMTVVNNSSKAVNGTASLKIEGNAGWKYDSTGEAFNLAKKGDKAAVNFDVTIPANTNPGSYKVSGAAKIGEAFETLRMHTIAYPHIQTHRYYTPAESRFEVLDIKAAAVKIGYIAGSGDKVAEAIGQLGLDVAMLDEKFLSTGDLSGLDVIVAGIRVSEVRPDFAANNARLLEWVKNGGTMIVQYQRPLYAQQNLTPYPAQMGPRVADENAAVTILRPEHPLMSFPNKITAEDFKGWVQERNLYNFSTFDERYVPMLESHDAGEAENRGGLVVADVGKGKYIYCSYSLFRQLPAGVPGAYRLLANMLSLPKARQTSAEK